MNPPREVIERARSGASDALDELIVAIWDDTYRLAYAVLKDAHAAQDAAQEACVIVCRSIASVRSADAFRVWLYRIVVREASRIRKTLVHHDELDERAVEDGASDVLDLWRALGQLPQTLRDVVVLRYFEDLSSSEIATVLGVPSGTVRFRLMLAKRQLRPLLELEPSMTDSGSEKVGSHAF